MTIFNISRSLEVNMAVWPGDDRYKIETELALDQGDIVNLTRLTLSAHTGTHVDAPSHFSREGKTIDQLSLRPFWGIAQVVEVEKESGPLDVDDLAGHDLGKIKRLLVKSPASLISPELFPDGYVYPSPELADYLGSLGIILYGTDCPSVDHAGSDKLLGHHALFRNGISILEWLDLSRVSDGLYEMVALPLNIRGGDGSPVRAALRPLEP